jgi:glutamate dehydrogenase
LHGNPTSPQAQRRRIAAERATPPEVMNAILKAPVDLLWFGGISAYVRRRGSDAAVGDRANDAIAPPPRAVLRVIGEERTSTSPAQPHRAALRASASTPMRSTDCGVNTSDVRGSLKIR